MQSAEGGFSDIFQIQWPRKPAALRPPRPVSTRPIQVRRRFRSTAARFLFSLPIIPGERGGCKRHQHRTAGRPGSAERWALGRMQEGLNGAMGNRVSPNTGSGALSNATEKLQPGNSTSI
jgi:hypothetical protein